MLGAVGEGQNARAVGAADGGPVNIPFGAAKVVDFIQQVSTPKARPEAGGGRERRRRGSHRDCARCGRRDRRSTHLGAAAQVVAIAGTLKARPISRASKGSPVYLEEWTVSWPSRRDEEWWTRPGLNLGRHPQCGRARFRRRASMSNSSSARSGRLGRAVGAASGQDVQVRKRCQDQFSRNKTAAKAPGGRCRNRPRSGWHQRPARNPCRRQRWCLLQEGLVADAQGGGLPRRNQEGTGVARRPSGRR